MGTSTGKALAREIYSIWNLNTTSILWMSCANTRPSKSRPQNPANSLASKRVEITYTTQLGTSSLLPTTSQHVPRRYQERFTLEKCGELLGNYSRRHPGPGEEAGAQEGQAGASRW